MARRGSVGFASSCAQFSEIVHSLATWDDGNGRRLVCGGTLEAVASTFDAMRSDVRRARARSPISPRSRRAAGRKGAEQLALNLGKASSATGAGARRAAGTALGEGQQGAERRGFERRRPRGKQQTVPASSRDERTRRPRPGGSQSHRSAPSVRVAAGMRRTRRDAARAKTARARGSARRRLATAATSRRIFDFCSTGT